MHLELTSDSLSMPLTSINSTNPSTNHRNFRVCHFEIFFCYIPMKISQSFLGSKNGSYLMITLVSSSKQHMPKYMQHSVGEFAS